MISIHALRKESDPPKTTCADGSAFISIHALRKESDLVSPIFQPS